MNGERVDHQSTPGELTEQLSRGALDRLPDDRVHQADDLAIHIGHTVELVVIPGLCQPLFEPILQTLSIGHLEPFRIEFDVVPGGVQPHLGEPLPVTRLARTDQRRQSVPLMACNLSSVSARLVSRAKSRIPRLARGGQSDSTESQADWLTAVPLERTRRDIRWRGAPALAGLPLPDR